MHLLQGEFLGVGGDPATGALARFDHFQITQVQVMTEDELASAEAAAVVRFEHHALYRLGLVLLVLEIQAREGSSHFPTPFDLSIDMGRLRRTSVSLIVRNRFAV